MSLRRAVPLLPLLAALAWPACRADRDRAEATPREPAPAGQADAAAPAPIAQPGPGAAPPAPPRPPPTAAPGAAPPAGPQAAPPYSLGPPWDMGLVEALGRGVMVERLAPESFAVPLLQPGDILIAVNGRPVTTNQDVERLLRAVPPGAMVVITIRRDEDIHYVMLQVPSRTDTGQL